MKYKAVIFDMDGTLVDTVGDLEIYMNMIFKRYSLPEINSDNINSVTGGTIKDALEAALANIEKNKEKIDLYAQELNEEYLKKPVIKTCIYEGIDILLEKIKQKKVKIAVFSNKDHELVEKTVHTIFGEKMFDFVRGAVEGFPKKPDPAGAFLVAEKLGVTPNETLYIGDSDTDAITANSGGFKFIAALWGYKTKEEIAAAGGEIFISKPLELLDFLE